MEAIEAYYLTRKGKDLLEAGPALRPEVLDLLETLEGRTSGDVKVLPELLNKLLRQGYIGRMDEV